jgi:hypothetical protein
MAGRWVCVTKSRSSLRSPREPGIYDTIAQGTTPSHVRRAVVRRLGITTAHVCKEVSPGVPWRIPSPGDVPGEAAGPCCSPSAFHLRHPLSCLEDLDDDVLPPLTAYFVMRVGRLVRLPYFAPEDQDLAKAAHQAATSSRATLLANHGPFVSAPSLAQAMDSVEELEETARLFFLLQGRATRPLQPADVAQLSARCT